MSYLYKIISSKLPPYLYEIISLLRKSHRYPSCFQALRYRAVFFQNSFLPFTITEWIKFDSGVKDIDSRAMFCKKLFNFIRPLENNSNGSSDPLGVRLLNRLRMGFSHLVEHKFRHNFGDTLNPLLFMLSWN